MPIYEYRCPTCEAEVECFQKISDPPPKCAACEKGRGVEVEMKKLISRGSFILKGGGWADEGYG